MTTLTDCDNSALTYTYDAAGNVSTMTDYHGSVVGDTYTDRNEVSTITAPGSKVWDYDYNALRQPTKVSIPNGMTTEYAYDGRNRMTKIEHKDGATVDDGFTYALTVGGNITKTTNQDNSYWDYWYDQRNRLTKAERKNSGGTLLKRWTYTYSLADNMTTKETYDGTTTETYTYAFTPGNELTKQTLSGTDTNFAYDDWGRMISKYSGGSAATYSWNYGDKLTKVASNFAGEGTVDYDYGGDAKRRERVSGGVTTWYNYDRGWNLLNEEDGSDNLSMTYVHDPVRPIGTVMADLAGATPSSGTARYYNQDNIGSTRRLRDASKGSLGQYEYEPYGADYSTSGASITGKFTGHDWDDTSDLYYAPYRYYAPTLAQWQSRDPQGLVDGPNVYSYTKRNPILLFDPEGKSVWDSWYTFLAWFGGTAGDPLDCVGNCMGTRIQLSTDLIQLSVGLAVAPIPKRLVRWLGMTVITIKGSSRWTTIIRLARRAGYLSRPFFHTVSKLSPGLIIADGAIAMVRISWCIWQCKGSFQ